MSSKRPSFPIAPRWPASNGASLVEVIIALAMLAAVVLAAARFHASALDSERHVEIASDRNLIQDILLDTVDCGATLVANAIDPATCVSTAPIELIDKGGITVVSASDAAPTQIGEWTVRARCFASGTGAAMGIHVEVARPDATNPTPLTGTGTNFAADPMSLTKLDWSGANPKMSLFHNGAQLCRGSFLPATCPSTGATLGAPSGGIPPILPAPAGSSMNPAQCLTPVFDRGGLLMRIDGLGQKTCRYYVPLVRGGDGGCIKSGPGTWQFKIIGGGSDVTDHYGNRADCPLGWKAAGGGAMCDWMTTVTYNAGGLAASGQAYESPLNSWHWTAQCLGFFQAGTTPEAIDNGVYVDCLEPER